MLDTAALLAQESNAGGITAILISTLGTVVVGLLSYFGARSTRSRDEKKNISTGDYVLRNLDLATQVEWEPVSEEEWSQKLRWMKRARVAAAVVFIGGFFLTQVSFWTGSPSSLLSFIPTIALFVVAFAAEIAWFMLNQAIHSSEGRTAAEAGMYELELLVRGRQEDILSRCVAAMRKIGHAVAAVHVKAEKAQLVSIGDYGNERLEVDLLKEASSEYRIRLHASRKASFSSSKKSRSCVLRMVEQLTGYPLYTSPPSTRKASESGAGALPSASSELGSSASQ